MFMAFLTFGSLLKRTIISHKCWQLARQLSWQIWIIRKKISASFSVPPLHFPRKPKKTLIASDTLIRVINRTRDNISMYALTHKDTERQWSSEIMSDTNHCRCCCRRPFAVWSGLMTTMVVIAATSMST